MLKSRERHILYNGSQIDHEEEEEEEEGVLAYCTTGNREEKPRGK